VEHLISDGIKHQTGLWWANPCCRVRHTIERRHFIRCGMQHIMTDAHT